MVRPPILSGAARHVTAGLILLGAGSAAAAPDGQAREALERFGRHAGYIVATVPHCGGDEAEVDLFAGMVRRMLKQAGAGADDLAVVETAMASGRADAAPVAQDCTDQGGRALAAELMGLRDSVRDAVAREAD